VTSPFLGEIRLFGFDFAPTGWAMCNGQLLLISQNDALFSLLGTFYGGDGVSTFGLPNLQSRVPVHLGQGSGLSPYTLGQAGGVETVTLTAAQMPLHSHSLNADATEANSDAPGGHALAKSKTHVYGTRSSLGAALTAKSIGDTGNSQPHANIQPYLTLNFCIALSGVFPSRS
jgi:microcystin-dependent protein